jgi:hypothetical protein
MREVQGLRQAPVKNLCRIVRQGKGVEGQIYDRTLLGVDYDRPSPRFATCGLSEQNIKGAEHEQARS